MSVTLPAKHHQSIIFHDENHSAYGNPNYKDRLYRLRGSLNQADTMKADFGSYCDEPLDLVIAAARGKGYNQIIVSVSGGAPCEAQDTDHGDDIADDDIAEDDEAF